MSRSAVLLLVLAGSIFSAGHLRGDENVTIELDDGATVRGRLLAKDARVVHLLIAGNVLTIERARIKDMKAASQEEAIPKDVREFALYRTATGVVKSMQTLSEQLGAAIVVVKTPSGQGTGWFCHPDGYVVTNQHVIAGEQSITITARMREKDRLGKRVFRNVKLVALNQHVDLALLKIEEDLDIQIPQLYIGDSTTLKEGEKVFTIGNPMGLELSIAQGIISKVNRNLDGRLYVQTTAPIAPGNSGGPLFNERGQVVGVTNMGYVVLDGLGFAIPSVYVKEFLDNVEAHAYDPDNPNAGVKYMEAPLTATDKTIAFTGDAFIKGGQGVSCLTLADMDGDGVDEIVFVNNNKAEIGVVGRRAGEAAPERALDFEDVNRLPEDDRFKLVTHPVNNSIGAIAVGDTNGDARPDIVFHGDIDGLAVLEQTGDGGFSAPRRIADFEVAKRIDALCLVDLDGDGEKEIFALGIEAFAVFADGADGRVFTLDARYRDSITEFLLTDLSGDGRLDLVLFCTDQFYATHIILQNARGDFSEDEWLPSHLSGPVKYAGGGAAPDRFLTLDKGQNRIRELVLATQEQPVQKGRINVLVKGVPPSLGGAGGVDDVEIADLDGDGADEIIAPGRKKSEFVILRADVGALTMTRTPAPRNASGLKLFRLGEKKTVLFSCSQADKMFGVSRVDETGVTFPRPINVEGLVQFLWIGRVDDDEGTLLWVEKVGADYLVRTASAAHLAEKAFDGGVGSIDIETRTLSFGDDEKNRKTKFRKRPERLVFADFNGDGLPDLVVHWSYSGKESLFLGLGERTFKPVIVEQAFLEDQKGQPLLVHDIDGDGSKDVLLVQSGFVRVLRVDAKDKLYVERQINWDLGEVRRLLPYVADGSARFVALAGKRARIVEFDAAAARFSAVGVIDLAGLDAEGLKCGDFDGNGSTDLLLAGGASMQLLYSRNNRGIVRSRNVFDARLDNFTYWKFHPADLDGDGTCEVLLFDSKKAMFEIYRVAEDGTLTVICRRRLFEKTTRQQVDADTYELPQETAVGDVDGDGKADLIFILQDRIAIYLQAANRPAAIR